MFSFGNHNRFLENLATRGQRAIEQSAPKLIFNHATSLFDPCWTVKCGWDLACP